MSAYTTHRFDKITENELKPSFMENVVLVAYPFAEESKKRMENVLDQFVDVYARVVTLNNRGVAHNQLKARE